MKMRRLLGQPLLTIAIHDREARWTLGGRSRVRAQGRVALPPGALSDGVVADPATTGQLLRDGDGFPRGSRMQVVVAIPAQRSVFRQVELPLMRGKQFDELVAREIRREMPMLAENAHISWQRVADREGKGVVFVVGVARDVLDSHIAAVRAAGLQPQSVDLRIIAAARAVGATDAIIANIEDDEMEIGIFIEGVPAIIRYVAMSAPCGEPAWRDQVGEELARTLKFYRDSHRDDVTIDALPITFVGGAARHAILAANITASTAHEVAMPALRLTITPEQETQSYAANIGLALKDLAA